MKITFTTNAKSFEKANYILAQALSALYENEEAANNLGLKNIDIHEVGIFRKQLVKGFISSAKITGKKEMKKKKEYTELEQIFYNEVNKGIAEDFLKKITDQK